MAVDSSMLNATRAREFRGSIAPLVTILLAVVAVWPALASLTHHWLTVGDYRHGPIVAAFVVGWLLTRYRRIAAEIPQPDARGLAALLVACVAWLASERAGMQLGIQILAPLVLGLAIFAAAGSGVARWFVGPLLLFACAVPFWDLLLPLLQWATIWVSTFALGALGVPVTISGADFTIPSGTFTIAEGCAGKRFLLVMVTLAAIASVVNQIRGKRLAQLLALACACAMVMNWVRVVVIIWLGYATNMRHYFVAREHDSFGWVLFALAAAPVLYVASRFAAVERVAPAVSPSATRGSLLRWAPAACVLVLAWLAAAPRVEARARLEPFPLLTGEWQGPNVADTAWSPSFGGADDVARGAYSAAGSSVEVFAAVYGSQRAGRKVVGEQNSVFDRELFRLQPDWRPADVTSPAAVTPHLVSAIGADGARWLAAYAYRVGGISTSSGPFAQAWYGLRAIVGDVPSGVVAIAMRCEGDCSATERTLLEFWDRAGPRLIGMVPSTTTHLAEIAGIPDREGR